MQYWLYHDIPYEPYFSVVGPIQEIVEWIKDNPHVPADDLSIFLKTDIDIYDLVAGIRGEIE